MGLFGTTDPRAVRNSAWVFVIFGCGHICLGESLATALVEVKFNSLTLAVVSYDIAKDLMVFSISPLSRSREIEFSLNIIQNKVFVLLFLCVTFLKRFLASVIWQLAPV